MKSPLLLTIECSGFSPRVSLHHWNPIRKTLHEKSPETSTEFWQPLASRSCPPEARSAAELLPMVRGLYDQLQITPKQTSAVAVTYGPGSFTSLRIGVTTAKMLAFCWRVPAIPINTLDLHLVASMADVNHQRSAERKRWAVTNAYRQQFYGKSIRIEDKHDAAGHPFGRLENESDSETFEQKMDQFDAHFESAFSVAQSFEGETVDDNSPRFDLNEHSIQQLEKLFPQSFWKLEQSTDAIDSEKLLQHLCQPAAENEVVVAVEPKLAANLRERLNQNDYDRVITPQVHELDAAFGCLAWQSFQFLSVDQLNPFRLQPIYYRPSAAEEAWASKQ